jgi:hypothetical protein
MSRTKTWVDNPKKLRWTPPRAKFQRELGAMGYKFQFVTLAGFHALNHSMFELGRSYRDRGMAAYSEPQQAEFASESDGYTATCHQREVGTGYLDLVAQTVAGGEASTGCARRVDRSRSVHDRGRAIREFQQKEMDNARAPTTSSCFLERGFQTYSHCN